MGVLYHDVGILRGRKEHAAASAKLLESEPGGYIFSEEDKIFVSSIVLSHSSSVDIGSCPPDQIVKGHDIRPRTIAALVRMADELDFSTHSTVVRVPALIPGRKYDFLREGEILRDLIDREIERKAHLEA